MDGLKKIITPVLDGVTNATTSHETLFNLNNILESSFEGQFLLNLNQKLNERQRKMLVDLIVVYVINQNNKISVAFAKSLSDQIIIVFPK